MKYIIVILLFAVVSCKKNDEPAVVIKPPATLLTQKTWLISGAGFDDNKNGVLDPAENTLQDCQKDNSFIFNTNGTGAALDNALTCGAPVNNNFDWKFTNNNTALEIATQPHFILKLNESELILSPDTPWLTVSFMTVYRH